MGRLCLVYSTMFELTELSLQFLIPEFQECWWDSVFLDWACSNLLGMALGHLTLQLLSLALREEPHTPLRLFGGRVNFRRMLFQFLPFTMLSYTWTPQRNPLQTVLVQFSWQVPLLAELNSFFLINVFKIPRGHWFNYIRQCMLLLMACPTTAEWYWYVHSSRGRIGHHYWLMFLTVATESYMAVKYSVDLAVFSSFVPPAGIWIPWLCFSTLYGTYMALYTYQFYRLRIPEPRPWLRFIKVGAFVPLLALARYYAF